MLCYIFWIQKCILDACRQRLHNSGLICNQATALLSGYKCRRTDQLYNCKLTCCEYGVVSASLCYLWCVAYLILSSHSTHAEVFYSSVVQPGCMYGRPQEFLQGGKVYPSLSSPSLPPIFSPSSTSISSCPLHFHPALSTLPCPLHCPHLWWLIRNYTACRLQPRCN